MHRPGNAADLPEVDESDLDRLDIGLYRLKGARKRADFYRPTTDTVDRDIDLVQVARIDEGGERPIGCEYHIRSDGKRVIVGWYPAQGGA